MRHGNAPVESLGIDDGTVEDEAKVEHLVDIPCAVDITLQKMR